MSAWRRAHPNAWAMGMETYYLIAAAGWLASGEEDWAERLIWCGALDVVDDENVDGTFGGYEFEAELLLDRGEDGRGGVGWRRRGRQSGVGGAGVRSGAVVGRPLQRDVVVAGEAGLVDDGAAELAGEDGQKEGHRGSLRGDFSPGDHETAGSLFVSGIGWGLLELWATFADGGNVDGQFSGLVVRDQLETIRQHLLKHRAALVEGEDRK